MSRIGKMPVSLPKEVDVVVDKNTITVKGPKGELKIPLTRGIDVLVNDGEVKVSAKKDKLKAMHGTTRAHLANMVHGVMEGWSKTLELVGAGYRAETDGKKLTLTVGFSHPVIIDAPDGINFEVQKSDITVSGISKELVGKIADIIRAVRPPEPYKGKGIKYKDEVVRRKPGKAAKAQGVAA